MDTQQESPVKKFFSQDEWNIFSDYEKKNYIKQYQNYLRLNSVGLCNAPPPFISENQNRGRSRKRKCKKIEDDVDWVPSSETKMRRKSYKPKATSNRTANGEQNNRYPKKCMKSANNQETKSTESSFELNCSQHEVLECWPRVAFLHPLTIGVKSQAKLMYIEGEDLINFKDYCSRISSGEPVSHSTYSDLLKRAVKFIEKTTNPTHILNENATETVNEPSDCLQIEKKASELSDYTDKMLECNLSVKEIERMAMKQSEVNDFDLSDDIVDFILGDENNFLIGTNEAIDNYVNEGIPIEPLHDSKKSEDCDACVKHVKDDEETERRYPKRKNISSNTYEDTVNIIDDNVLYCEHCFQEFSGHCPKHETVLVSDNPVPRTVTNRARLSAPYPLQVKESKVPFAGLGVFTTENLPCCLVFGPYQGIFSLKSENKADSGYGWHIRTLDLNGLCVDAVDTSVSNWMRYVNCARDDREINLAAFQYNGNIYYRTIRNIPRATELMVWYGDDYGKELGLKPVTPKVVNHISSDKSCLQTFKHDFTSSNFGEKNKQIISRPRNENPSVSKDNNENSTKLFKKQIVETTGINCDDFNVDKENSPAIKGIKKFKCTYCDYQSNNSGTLKTHIKKHTGEKLKCTYCDFQTIQSSNLKAHERIHTGEKLKCSQCDYETLWSGTLKTHERIHTGEKLKCTYCDFQTIQSSNLKRHERIHTGNKLKCSQCDFQTIQSGYLKAHERIHTGNKLKCSQCDYETIWSGDLKKHEKRKHK